MVLTGRLAPLEIPEKPNMTEKERFLTGLEKMVLTFRAYVLIFL